MTSSAAQEQTDLPAKWAEHIPRIDGTIDTYIVEIGVATPIQPNTVWALRVWSLTDMCGVVLMCAI